MKPLRLKKAKWPLIAIFFFVFVANLRGTTTYGQTRTTSTSSPQGNYATGASERNGHRLFVGWSPFGIHFPTYFTQPVSFGIYLGNNVLIGMEYGSYSREAEFGDHKASATYTNSGVFARTFSGHSFNFYFAAHKRTFEGELHTKINGKEYATKANAEATVASLGVGNQWTFDPGFILGFDWAVVSQRLSSSSKVEIQTSDTLSDSDRASMEKDGEEVVDWVNTASALPGLLILSIGWAF